MHEAVIQHLEESSIIIKAAAVADYHRADAPQHKVKKTAARMSLELILRRHPRRTWPQKRRPPLIGFAAETENLIGEPARKLEIEKLRHGRRESWFSQEGIGFGFQRKRSRAGHPHPRTRIQGPARALSERNRARILDETIEVYAWPCTQNDPGALRALPHLYRDWGKRNLPPATPPMLEILPLAPSTIRWQKNPRRHR